MNTESQSLLPFAEAVTLEISKIMRKLKEQNG